MSEQVPSVVQAATSELDKKQKKRNVWASLPLPKTNNPELAAKLAKLKGIDDVNLFYAPTTTEKRRKMKQRQVERQAERAKYASTNAWATMVRPIPNRKSHKYPFRKK
jgi:hypothetical protein